jgi:hypothetical protein
MLSNAMPHPFFINTTFIKETFNRALISALRAVNSTPRNSSGVWYYVDYVKFCENSETDYKESYKNGFANPDYWEMTAPYTYKIKSGVKPDVAIKSFLQGFTIADCGSVIVACQYAALLNVLGEEKFNTMFDEDGVALTISQFIFDAVTNPITYFFIRADKTPGKGDMCHFEGVSFYAKKHPLGNARGWNVVCTGKNESGENLYYGFGPNDFAINSVSIKIMNKMFLDYYNQQRDNLNKQWIANHPTPEEYDLLRQNLPENMDDKEAEIMIKGYEVNSTVSPDWVKIQRFSRKNQLTADEFMDEYDSFLISQGHPSFFSRPCSSSIVLPVVTAPLPTESTELDRPVRIGIPSFF